MTSSVKAVINPELRNIHPNEGIMQGFRLWLGVEDTVYVTLLFSLFSYSQLWWNSIVTYTASSTPSKNQDFNNIRKQWIYDGRTTHFFSTLDYVQIYKGSTFLWFFTTDFFLAPPGTRIKNNGKKYYFIWCLEGLHACCRAFARVAWRTLRHRRKTLGSSRK